MRTYIQTQIVVVKKEKTICNMCGEEIKDHDYLDLSLRIEKTWGYGTPWDGERHVIDVCEACYRNMLENMAVKPFEAETELAGGYEI